MILVSSNDFKQTIHVKNIWKGRDFSFRVALFLQERPKM